MKKLWERLSYRMLMLHQDDLKEHFHNITYEKMKIFVNMCNIEIYEPGQAINIHHGGVLLRGSIKLEASDKYKFTKKSKKEAEVVSKKSVIVEEGELAPTPEVIEKDQK